MDRQLKTIALALLFASLLASKSAVAAGLGASFDEMFRYTGFSSYFPNRDLRPMLHPALRRLVQPTAETVTASERKGFLNELIDVLGPFDFDHIRGMPQEEHARRIVGQLRDSPPVVVLNPTSTQKLVVASGVIPQHLFAPAERLGAFCDKHLMDASAFIVDGEDTIIIHLPALMDDPIEGVVLERRLLDLTRESIRSSRGQKEAIEAAYFRYVSSGAPLRQLRRAMVHQLAHQDTAFLRRQYLHSRQEVFPKSDVYQRCAVNCQAEEGRSYFYQLLLVDRMLPEQAKEGVIPYLKKHGLAFEGKDLYETWNRRILGP